jgi:hypothetical protein
VAQRLAHTLSSGPKIGAAQLTTSAHQEPPGGDVSVGARPLQLSQECRVTGDRFWGDGRKPSRQNGFEHAFGQECEESQTGRRTMRRSPRADFRMDANRMRRHDRYGTLRGLHGDFLMLPVLPARAASEDAAIKNAGRQSPLQAHR